MRPNRIRTKTAAKIFGVDVPYLIEKVRIGKYPIGIYEKHGKRAHTGKLSGSVFRKNYGGD